MEPTSMQKTKEDLAFKAGETRQAARDLNETDPTATAPIGSETSHPTLGERLREGYQESKDSVSYAAQDLKEKMSLHPQTTHPSTAMTGSAFDDPISSYPSGAATTSAYPSSTSTVETEGETHKPSLTERLRETYEGAKDTVMEKAHELKEKIAPSPDPVAVNATASTALGAPRVGGTETSTADVPDAPHGMKVTTTTTDVGTTHTFGERVRDSVRETAHNVKEKLENLTGMGKGGAEEEDATRTDYETTSSNAPDYTYGSVGTSATHPDYTQDAKNAYHDTANTSADKYHEMKNAAADKYHEMKNAAADKYHETKNAASDYAQSAKNKANEYAEEAREKMEEWRHQPSSSSSSSTSAAAAKEAEEMNLAAGSQAQKYVTSTKPGSVTTTTTTVKKEEPKP